MDEAVNQKYILVVEDDAAYGKVFQRKLSHEGFEVNLVNNVKEALAEVKKRLPDLMILDLMMPESDGFEVLKTLKSDEHSKNLKIIVATNLSQDVDVEKTKNAGASDYFVKSDLSVSAMVSKVRQNLNK